MWARTLPVALEHLVEREVRLPVCPIVFVRLTEALERADDRNFDLGTILSSDPALTAQVLRVANSAAYGLKRSVGSVEEAIFRLGYREVWSIASALKAKALFQGSPQEWTNFSAQLWEHSLRTAVLARAVGQHLRLPNSEQLFTAGILHDIGKTLLYRANPEYVLLSRNGALAGGGLIQLEQDFFGTHHARLGGEMLGTWGLPEILSRLVCEHHDETHSAEMAQLHEALGLANYLSHAASEAADGSVRLDQSVQAPPRPLLDTETCQRIAGESRRTVSALKTM